MKIYVILYKIKQKNLNGKKYRKESKEIIEKKDIEKKEGKKERK